MNIKTFIHRPLLSMVISVIIVLLGVISLLSLPMERYPDIAPPAIYVWASYPGASAETVQKSVVMPLEEALNGVEGMTYHAVERVLVLEHIVVGCHETEGVGAHVVVVLVLDTACGEDGLGQSLFVVGVGIEEGVAAADSGVVVLLIDTGALGIGLVGVVHDIVLALGV